MKNLICAVLALASLTSLSACSGQTNPTSVYPTAQLNAPVPTAHQALIQGGLTPVLDPASRQDALTQVNQPALQHSDNNPQAAATAPIPGSRSYSKSIFDKPTPAKASTSSLPDVSKQVVPVKTAASTPAPAAAAAKASVSQAAAAQQVLTQAVERFKTLESVKFNVDGFETVIGKSPSRLSFTFASLQGKAKIEVLKHTNSMYVGVKMGYQDGQDAISVRPGGMLGFVKVDTKMNDERLSTPRGYRLDQIDAFAISKRLLGQNHTPKVLGKTQLDGRSVAILEYTKVNDFDQRITRELLAIDLEDHFIRMHEMYEGETLVFSLKLSNIQLNAPVAAADLGV